MAQMVAQWFGTLVGSLPVQPLNCLRMAQPNAAGNDMVNGKYGITTWSLFDGDPTQVPDGGLTVALLGSALTCLGLLRQKLG
jgi:hypothetical protein